MVSQVASVEEVQVEGSLRVADAQSLGLRLRAVRRQMHLSLQAVETLSRAFKSSVLGAYERGERNIQVPRLKQLARLYDVPLDELLAHDAATSEPDGGDEEVVENSPWARRPSRPDGDSEKVTIDLSRLDAVTRRTRPAAPVPDHDPAEAPGFRQHDDHDPGRRPPRHRLPVRSGARRRGRPPRPAGPAQAVLTASGVYGEPVASGTRRPPSASGVSPWRSR